MQFIFTFTPECSCVTCVNDAEACTRLLVATHGIDVNAQDDMGNTPLHVAIDHQLARCVEILISAGADVCLRLVFTNYYRNQFS